MPLNDVTAEMKCFDLSHMSLNPSVTNFETSRGFCSFETGGYKCQSGIHVLHGTAVPSSPSHTSFSVFGQNSSLCSTEYFEWVV